MFGVLGAVMALFGSLADVVPLNLIMIGAGAVLVRIAVVLGLNRGFKKNR